MSDTPYLASTYLRMLRSDPTLLPLLKTVFGVRLQSMLDSEFVYQADIERIFEACVSHGVDSWLLTYGEQISIASHGPLGFAMLSAADLRMALSVWSDYGAVRTSTYTAEFTEDDALAHLIIHDQTGHPLLARWLAEMAIRVAQKLSEAIVMHSLGAHARIAFAHAQPAYSEQLSALYGIPCSYDSASTRLSMPVSWLQISSPLSDPATFRTNLAKCDEIQSQLSAQNDVVQRVRFILAHHFSSQSPSMADTVPPSLTQLAEQQHTSTRTLARKLSEQNTSYKQLVQIARQQRAYALLKETHFSVADIAYCLGYRESANFIRAFKRWCGVSPTRWRQAASTQKSPR
ncbi:AraC family transcriptional regulator [Arenicella chitinivorans]|uniref:AraC family transcriptional regulator n=1 Tax=Arenicella chitinivorans TaxID=1329800 RepID=A0A918RM99_9GAMM|nr:AraC family transcriptional regulator [Arenicella chitinivorans]GHA04774.1 AraC family transcriptional regulator [Arenicella chitinivorans]